ncbi:hypothetical protein [Ruminococcus flavefaciens]|uniref:hypothetical protein n=1 Tax=Ruminococcus flavefaciens TaxID=1265 RepID=UPI0026EAE304|nr:hypothetical protein [Ruminococcus flavefaciens]
MDKKLFRAMAAALILTVTAFSAGCQDKKKPQPVTSEDMGDYSETIAEAPETTEAPVFREYTESDFKDVDMSLTIVDKEPPVEVSSIDISGLDYGEKVPVCNKEEFAEEYYTNMREFYNGSPMYNWKDFAGKAMTGSPHKCHVWNGKCYIYVIYECFEYADWSLFSYDMASGKAEEIYSWSAANLDERSDRNACFCEGSLFFAYSGKDGNTPTSTVKRIDLETGEEKTLYEAADIDITIWLHTNDSGNAELQEYHNVSEKGTVIYKYDTDKDEFVQKSDIDVPEGRIMASDCFGGVYSYLVKPDGKRKYELVNDYYRISTPLTTGRIVYADQKLAILYNNVKLHIYNLEKMEHCILDVDDFGSEMAVYDGKLFIGHRSSNFRMPVYCVIPELGITYPIVEPGIYSDIWATADGVTFIQTSRQENVIKSGTVSVDENGEVHEEYEVVDENGEVIHFYTGSFSHQYDRIDKVYTVKKK